MPGGKDGNDILNKAIRRFFHFGRRMRMGKTRKF